MVNWTSGLEDLVLLNLIRVTLGPLDCWEECSVFVSLLRIFLKERSLYAPHLKHAH